MGSGTHPSNHPGGMGAAGTSRFLQYECAFESYSNIPDDIRLIRQGDNYMESFSGQIL